MGREPPTFTDLGVGSISGSVDLLVPLDAGSVSKNTVINYVVSGLVVGWRIWALNLRAS